ncbi:hypothetical protein K469DRAFT_812277 [Zopfia rhizophila CBS 207.26]|uniref:DUF7730 domain-containing protein n=1 Tax=Zopfia rhizophila CBS 207.26 TaxID=1314779 RepID=A0A6A6DD27_9PEZI|nr:hypothetical protein K469DRAFT_812277 [Zopfia rhizophila CBS 207.26]
MYTSINPQLKSKFFVSPAEIRRAIYVHFIPDQIHLFLHKKGLGLSACVQRDKDGHPNCIERCSSTYPLTYPPASCSIYTLRLRSSWGSHWRCEESVKTDGNITAEALLLACKRMCIDVVEMMADIAVFQINDLDMLRILVLHSSVLKPGRSSTFASTFLSCVLPSLKELHISLRLSLSIYGALENAGNSTGSESSSMDHSISAWTGLRPAIERLGNLRRLRIWLDHGEPCSWSMVNERAVLSPLAPLSNNPNLDISIDLPKLHPKWENPDRHFTEDSPPLTLTIHRRYRQRYHGVESSDGSIDAKHDPDFPILYEVADLYYMTMEIVEEMERASWQRGEDPIKEFLDDSIVCSLPTI